MEEINIRSILKEYKGTEKLALYSPICGNCVLVDIGSKDIKVKANEYGYTINFDIYGHYYPFNGDCLLFPSKNDHDWIKFKEQLNYNNKHKLELKVKDAVLKKYPDANCYGFGCNKDDECHRCLIKEYGDGYKQALIDLNTK